MNENNVKIERFFKAFENPNFLTNKISFHLTRSSLETLRNVNLIIDSYLEDETTDNAKMLLNIFGMLGMFSFSRLILEVSIWFILFILFIFMLL